MPVPTPDRSDGPREDRRKLRVVVHADRESSRVTRSTDLTLGTFLDQFAEVRGDCLLAEQPRWASLHVRRGCRSCRGGRRLFRSGSRPAIASSCVPPTAMTCSSPVSRSARAGGVAVPVNPRMAPAEIAHDAVENACADVAIDDFDTILGDRPRPAVRVDPASVAVIFYTSGTTGGPKGAQLFHRALVGRVGGGTLAPEGLFRRGCVSGSTGRARSRGSRC